MTRLEVKIKILCYGNKTNLIIFLNYICFKYSNYEDISVKNKILNSIDKIINNYDKIGFS